MYLLADEKHSKCLTKRVYLPTIVSGRVICHLGYYHGVAPCNRCLDGGILPDFGMVGVIRSAGVHDPVKVVYA